MRIYTASSKLFSSQEVSKHRSGASGARVCEVMSYIIQDKQVRAQAFGKVLLDTCLLASQELSHDCLQTWRRSGKEEKEDSGWGGMRGMAEDVYRRDTAAREVDLPRWDSSGRMMRVLRIRTYIRAIIPLPKRTINR